MAGLWFLPTGCTPPPEGSAGVQLLLTTAELGPTTAFELRFDEPAVTMAEVGLAAEQSPLIFVPPVAGTFVWQSRRSGVFTPWAPLRLDTRYRLTLRSGLLNPEGRLLRAGLQQTLETPALQAALQFSPYPWENHWRPTDPSPTAYLLFNAAVDAEEIGAHVAFVAADGRQVAARCRPATETIRPAREGVVFTWEGRSWDAAFRDAEDPENRDAEAVVPDNQVEVCPAEPLPAAEGWQLVLKAGLAARERRLRLKADSRFDLGDILAFACGEARVNRQVGHQPSVTIEFTRNLQPLEEQGITREVWQLTPEPTAWRIHSAGPSLFLHGDFRVGQTYAITVPATLRDDAGVALGEATTRTFRFQPLAPRLYAPATSAEQMAQGQGEFRLLAVNVDRVQVRAKRLARANLVHALRGYGSYFKLRYLDRGVRDPHTPIDYNLVPGETVLDREMEATAGADETRVLTLPWQDLLGGRAQGAVFIDARQPRDTWSDEARLGVQSVIQRTDLGLHWKVWDTNVLVYVYSYRTGAPLADAKVELVSEEDQLRAEGITDAEGLVRLGGWAAKDWLVARLGEDLHAVPVEDYQRTLYQTGVDWGYSPWAWEKLRVLVFSDRSVYRPGDTLHFKAIAREIVEDDLRIPTNLVARLELQNPRWDDVWQTNLVFDHLGSATVDIALPETPRGTYVVKLQGEATHVWHEIQMQDYQPDAFEVTLALPSELPPNQSLRIPVQARYLFGAPITRAEAAWTVQAEDGGFGSDRYPGWFFCGGEYLDEFGRGSSSLVVQGGGVHTAATNLVVLAEIPVNPVAPQPRTVDVELQLTDLNQQTIVARARSLLHSSAFYLGLRTPTDIVGAGEVQRFEIAAVSSDGTPWPDPVQVTARVHLVEWRTSRIKRAGGRPEYRSDPVLTNTVERVVEVHPWSAYDLTAASPSAVELTLDAPGQYLVDLETVDPGGNRVLTTRPFYAAAKARLAWDYRNAALLELVPDRELYRPGDTATLLVKAPFSGRAWVSVERASVRRSFLTRLEGNAPLIQVPIEAGDIPNVFVAVTLLRGSADSPVDPPMPDFRFGACALSVDPSSRRLGLALTSDADHYAPGAPVTTEVQVTDADAAPVVGAEVTWFAVDEGVLNLGGFELPDPMAFFHGPRPLEVRSALSLFKLMGEDPERWTFGNKGYIGGGGGRGAESLRRNWEPCPMWIGSVFTDTNGMAKARFTAPDSLTRYRLIAIGQTAQSQFGSGTATFEVRQPLMISPSLPQFARVGDVLQARALVHNQTAESQTVEVQLELDATAVFDSGEPDAARREVRLDPGASAVVDIPVRFVAAGPAVWAWRARTIATDGREVFRDGAQSELEVGQVRPRLRQVLHTLAEGPRVALLGAADPRVLEGEGQVVVQLARSRLMELGEAVRQLLHYPYGCVEQTSSSLLPWVVLKRAPVLLTAVGDEAAKADPAVASGIARLFGMQTSSGGLSYWPDQGAPTPWGSAYAAVVLALARAQGCAVPEDSFASLMNYLQTEVMRLDPSRSGADLAAQSLAALAFAIADRLPAGAADALFAARHRLTIEQGHLLAAALGLAFGADERTRLLLGNRKAENAQGDWYGSPERVSAAHLLAAAICEPTSPTVEPLVSELLDRRHVGHWRSTQGNAWALLALSEYALRCEDAEAEASGAIVSGEKRWPFALDAEHPGGRIVVDLSAVRDGQLWLEQEGGRRLHVEVELDSRILSPQVTALDEGFSLKRTYQRVAPDGALTTFDQLKVGDSVVVTLTVESRRGAHFVALEDPLPAVLEPVNLPARQTQPGGALDEPSGRRLYPSFQEMRKDRVRFFADHLGAGTYWVRYLARVRTAGDTVAPTAQVEAMYAPEVRGLSGTRQLVSTSDR